MKIYISVLPQPEIRTSKNQIIIIGLCIFTHGRPHRPSNPSNLVPKERYRHELSFNQRLHVGWCSTCRDMRSGCVFFFSRLFPVFQTFSFHLFPFEFIASSGGSQHPSEGTRHSQPPSTKAINFKADGLRPSPPTRAAESLRTTHVRPGIVDGDL